MSLLVWSYSVDPKFLKVFVNESPRHPPYKRTLLIYFFTWAENV